MVPSKLDVAFKYVEDALLDDDPLAKELVFFGKLQVIPDLSKDVRQGSGREHRLEDRRPIRFVCFAYSRCQKGLRRLQLGPLRGLLGDDLGKVGVESLGCRCELLDRPL